MTFAENLMTYALGRRVEAYDMPALRAIVARRREAERSDRRVHRRHHAERGVSDEPPRAGRDDGGDRHRPATDGRPRMIITKRHLSRRTVLKGLGVTVALPFLDAMAPAATALANTAAKGKLRFVAVEMVHGAAGSSTYGAQNNLWSPAAVGRSFDLSPTSLAPLEPLARLHHDRQQHRRADGRSVHDAGDRRRSFPRELGVPDAGASQADDGIGPVCRDVVRSDLRAAVRSGHGDSVDAALHRGRRSFRRLRIQLLLRLHRRDQLGVAERAAADAARSARGVRHAVRRRRHAGRSRAPAARGQERARHHRRVDRPAQAAGRRGRPRAAQPTTSTTCARSSAAFRTSRRPTAAARPARCRMRRWACPIRSTSTSS